jgi:hypothetical protein
VYLFTRRARSPWTLSLVLATENMGLKMSHPVATPIRGHPARFSTQARLCAPKGPSDARNDSAGVTIRSLNHRSDAAREEGP